MALTDSWCTPSWLTERLPIVDLDPCSNGKSTVRAKRKLTASEDGLDVIWTGSVYVNPPYSNPKPWCERAHAHATRGSAVLMLLKLDPTTAWWATLKREGASSRAYPFRERITFAPGPGMTTGTTANFPSVLVVLEHPQSDVGSVFDSAIAKLLADRKVWRPM